MGGCCLGGFGMEGRYFGAVYVCGGFWGGLCVGGSDRVALDGG